MNLHVKDYDNLSAHAQQIRAYHPMLDVTVHYNDYHPDFGGTVAIHCEGMVISYEFTINDTIHEYRIDYIESEGWIWEAPPFEGETLQDVENYVADYFIANVFGSPLYLEVAAG